MVVFFWELFAITYIKKVYRNCIVCTQLHSHIPNALYLCVQIVYQMLRAEVTLLKRVAIFSSPLRQSLVSNHNFYLPVKIFLTELLFKYKSRPISHSWLQLNTYPQNNHNNLSLVKLPPYISPKLSHAFYNCLWRSQQFHLGFQPFTTNS